MASSTPSLSRSNVIVRPQITPIPINDSLLVNYTQIGLNHNFMINNIANGLTISDVKAVKININDEDYKTIISPEFKQEYQKYVDLALANKRDEIVIDNYKTEEILKLYNDALARCPDKAHDIAYIVNLYVDAISKSIELKAEEKADIAPAIVVGAYSGVLWEAEKKDGLTVK